MNPHDIWVAFDTLPWGETPSPMELRLFIGLSAALIIFLAWLLFKSKG